MPPFTFGPVYCETMSATSASFPVEPMNTISNGVIVMFGLLGLYFVAKRAPRAADLYVLCALLIATGKEKQLETIFPGDADKSLLKELTDGNLPKTISNGYLRIGFAEGYARKDKFKEALDLIEIPGSPRDRLEACVGVGTTPGGRTSGGMGVGMPGGS